MLEDDRCGVPICLKFFSKYICIWFSMRLRRFEDHTWACSLVTAAWAQLDVY